VHGDALLVGETVVVASGSVIDGNLFTAAATVIINGKVSGSVFGGSSTAELKESAAIGRNLYYGGYSLTTKSGSLIGTDLFTGAYQAILSGSVVRDAKIGAGAIELNGSIGRNAVFNVGHDQSAQDPEQYFSYSPGKQYFPPAIPAGIRISSTARINGNLAFTSDTDQSSTFKPSTSGTIQYQTPVPMDTRSGSQIQTGRGNAPYVGFSLFAGAQRFITLLILGALAIWLLLKPFKKTIDAGIQKPLNSAGWGFIVIAVGFLAFLVIPLVFVLMAILLGFLSLGGLLFAWLGVVGSAILLINLAFLFLVFTVSKVIALYMAGKWLSGHLFPKSADNPWVILIVGVSLYVLLTMIPVVGWLVGIAAALVGTGSLWLAVRNHRESAKIVPVR
jgi:cytoskeletal protein CcmA (bactofilin family)